MLTRAIRCQASLLLLLVVSAAAWSQPTNLDLVRDCTRSIADSALLLAAVPTICYTVAQHPAAWLIEEAMVQTAEHRGNALRDCSDGQAAAITLAFTELHVLYRSGEASGTIVRECRVAVAVLAAPYGTEPQQQREFTAIRSDTLAATAVPLIEQPGYEYLRGVRLAPSGSNFWDTVLEPAIVLGAAAVSVILLFTVRSN